MTSFLVLNVRSMQRSGTGAIRTQSVLENWQKFEDFFFLNCINITFSARFKMFCFVYLQHHKDQMEIVIGIKGLFRKGLYPKSIF